MDHAGQGVPQGDVRAILLDLQRDVERPIELARPHVRREQIEGGSIQFGIQRDGFFKLLDTLFQISKPDLDRAKPRAYRGIFGLQFAGLFEIRLARFKIPVLQRRGADHGQEHRVVILLFQQGLQCQKHVLPAPEIQEGRAVQSSRQIVGRHVSKVVSQILGGLLVLSQGEIRRARDQFAWHVVGDSGQHLFAVCIGRVVIFCQVGRESLQVNRLRVFR